MSLKRQPNPDHRAGAFAVAATLAVAALMGACTNEQAVVATAQDGAGESQAQGVAAAEDVDWLAIEEDTVLPVLDELGESLQAAHFALDRPDPTAAAAEIRRGATFLESEIDGATKDQRARLAAAAAELSDLAEQMAGGLGVDANRLTTSFQEAYAADTQERWSLLEEEAGGSHENVSDQPS